MITFQGDGLEGFQQLTSPSVYLDNWAWRSISRNSNNAKKLVTVLKERGGTLVVSWVNLIEFSQIKDSLQLEAYVTLADSAWPNLFFLESNPDIVVKKEDGLLSRKTEAAPHAEDKLLKIFCELRRTGLNPFSFHELIDALQQPQIEESSKTFMASELNPLLDRLRNQVQIDLKQMAKAKKITSGPKLPCSTRYVFIEILKHLIRNKIRMTPGNWRDLLHLVVPMSYCDLVLVDKTWARLAKSIHERLRRAGVPIETASVFWEKEIGNFWQTLERWSNQEGSPFQGQIKESVIIRPW